MFYTYLWLREDGTPYYVGKGCGKRAYIRGGHRANVPPKERIVIYPAESEKEAFETEAILLWYYGRKDLGTGILINLTDGGEGISGAKLKTSDIARLRKSISHIGLKHSEETKKKQSLVMMGNKNQRPHKTSDEARENIKLSWDKRRMDNPENIGMGRPKRKEGEVWR